MTIGTGNAAGTSSLFHKFPRGCKRFGARGGDQDRIELRFRHSICDISRRMLPDKQLDRRTKASAVARHRTSAIQRVLFAACSRTTTATPGPRASRRFATFRFAKLAQQRLQARGADRHIRKAARVVMPCAPRSRAASGIYSSMMSRRGRPAARIAPTALTRRVASSVKDRGLEVGR